MKTKARRIAPFALIYLAAIVLRMDLIRCSGMSFGDALSPGVLFGFLYDLAILTAFTGLATALGSLFDKSFKTALALVWLVYLVSLASNLTYFRFFGTELPLWVIRLHWRDTAAVSESVFEVAFAMSIIVGTIMYVLASILLFKDTKLSTKRRLASAAIGVFFSVTGALLLQLPVWLNWVGFEGGHRFGEAKVVGENIIRSWIDSLIKGGGESAKAHENLQKMSARRTTPRETLARFRGAEQDAPMRWKFEPSQGESKELRRELGLPLSGQINIVVVFLESVRGYEFLEPTLAKAVFPKTHSIASRHGILFEQAYSSSAEAGQTVRGQFSSLCSSLPNFQSPAAFLAANQVSTVCLAQIFASLGHQTLWINAYDKVFHGTEAFERLHGTQFFYDVTDFASTGIEVRPGRLGIEDEEFLGGALKIIREKSRVRPVFANLATISTHHPHTINPRHLLPPESRALAGSDPHWNYLSQLSALDQALAKFIDGIFEDAEIGGNTIVAISADHSITIDSPLPTNEPARSESKFRIPLAFFTKNLKHPRRVQYPVHQIDIAPTLAAVAGWSGETTWIGRNILKGEGSPWVFLDKNGVSYRSGRRLCANGTDGIRCYGIENGEDPLFNTVQTEVRDPLEERFFEDSAISSTIAITLNLFKRK